jgi:hypothetical protein
MSFFSSIPIWGWFDIGFNFAVLVALCGEADWALKRLIPKKPNVVPSAEWRRKKLKKKFEYLLIFGIAGEVACLPFSLKESSDSNKMAGQAIERASTNESQVAALKKETAEAKLETSKIELEKVETERQLNLLFDDERPMLIRIDSAKLIAELKDKPKGIAEILYLKTDQAAYILALTIGIDLQIAGWRTLPPKGINVKAAMKLGNGQDISLRAKDGGGFDSKTLRFVFPTNSVLGALDASLMASRHGLLGIICVGDKSLKNGLVQIVVGQKAW